MVVYVEGKCNIQQQVVYSVIEYCYNKLIPQYEADIFVSLDDTSLITTPNGWCQHNHGNNFEIAINSNLSMPELIKTVCHEMVHVKQGVKNELVETHNTKYCRTWKGIEYNGKCKDEFPWELEAYCLEGKLYKTFMEQYNVKNKDELETQQRLH
jgi:hypothetical protein